ASTDGISLSTTASGGPAPNRSSRRFLSSSDMWRRTLGVSFLRMSSTSAALATWLGGMMSSNVRMLAIISDSGGRAAPRPHPPPPPAGAPLGGAVVQDRRRLRVAPEHPVPFLAQVPSPDGNLTPAARAREVDPQPVAPEVPHLPGADQGDRGRHSGHQARVRP